MLNQDHAAMEQCFKQISSSMKTMEEERDLIKEIVKKLYEEFGVPKPTARKMAKVFHKCSFQDEKTSFAEFEAFYLSLFGG